MKICRHNLWRQKDYRQSRFLSLRTSAAALVWQSVFPKNHVFTDISPENGFARPVYELASE